jgi:hypothetical protein
MPNTFTLGEVVWDMERRCVIQIAGPLNFYPQHKDATGAIVNSPIWAHRIVPFGPTGLAKFVIARPLDLRKLHNYTSEPRPTWGQIESQFGWKPAGVRS